MAHTPRDDAFVSAIAALRTRRDQLVTSARVAGGGIQITGFSSVKWQAIAPILAQHNKFVTIKEASQGSGGIALIATDVLDDVANVTIENIDAIHLKVDNLEHVPDVSVATESVSKLAYRFQRHGVGITSAALAGIQAENTVLDIEINGSGIFVYAVLPSRILSSLYYTIKKWKQSPHKSGLSTRPSKTFTKQKAIRQRRRRGWRVFPW